MTASGTYTTYQTFLLKHFACKVQKLTVDAGNTCPVRDGRLAVGGCSFCNGRGFSPRFCREIPSIAQQLGEGKRFFSRRVGESGEVAYLAYFQAATNTYGDIRRAEHLFREALQQPQTLGLVIATRPDCLAGPWLDLLSRLADETFVMVELGIESVSDEALQAVGRGHDLACSEQAILRLSRRGIPVGVHMILGLPADTRHTMFMQASWLNGLPVDVLKLHQLQIMKGARMATDFERNPAAFHLFAAQEYATLVADYLERLSPRIAVERFVSQCPADELIAPRWGLKADKVTQMVLAELKKRNSCQGCLLR